MKQCAFLIVLVGTVLFCTSTSRGGQISTAAILTVEDSCTDFVTPKELPLLEMPLFLTTPKEQASYILIRFCDGMDFRDTIRSRNHAFMVAKLLLVELFFDTQNTANQC